MADTVFLLVAILLLVIGVIGSVAPMLPGALFSMAGVLVYWWSTGFTTPGDLFILFTALIGGGAVLFDYFAGAIAAKAGGASTASTLVAAVLSVFLFFVTGPVGIILGVAIGVFAAEFYRTHAAGNSLKASLYAVGGLLSSAAVQLTVTVALLVGFLVAVLL